MNLPILPITYFLQGLVKLDCSLIIIYIKKEVLLNEGSVKIEI